MAEVQPGAVYLGTVTRLVDFGAFIEIMPNTEGLLHISEIAPYRVHYVRDELTEGQQVMVKCLAVEGNAIKLSRKAMLTESRLPEPTHSAPTGAALVSGIRRPFLRTVSGLKFKR